MKVDPSCRRFRARFLGGLGLLTLSLGCTTRPVVDGQPRGFRPAVTTPNGEPERVRLRATTVFVVDDSVSMGDKQRVLVETLQALAVTAAMCVRTIEVDSERVEVRTRAVNGRCAEGTEGFTGLWSAENPVVVTSSLEAAGACRDRSRGARPLGAPDESLGDQLEHVGEAGCGFESPLEAAYRLLVDPEPPADVRVVGVGQAREVVREGVDDAILGWRKDVLGPFGNVDIVFLTDEDDCSVQDVGRAWKIVDPEPLARGTAACAENPSDSCCRPCDGDESTPPAGCSPLVDDAACELGPFTAEEDPVNLRCARQKSRFGVESLFPVRRYIDGFTETRIIGPTGKLVDNPLFAGGRTPDMVRVFVLAGVPWQLLRDPEADEFRNFDAAGLERIEAWEKILGEPSTGIEPSDPHLRLSSTLRPGVASSVEAWDEVHGFDFSSEAGNELQPACQFLLPEFARCDSASGVGCACEDPGNAVRPECFDASLESSAPDQARATATPPPRMLEFARGLGGRAFVGSACPARTTPPEDWSSAGVPFDFGYAPAFVAGERSSGFVGVDACIAKLPVTDGDLDCVYLETFEREVDCAEEGLLPVSEERRAAVAERQGWELLGIRGTVCELPYFSGEPDDPTSDRYQCENERHPAVESEGFCYIDPKQGFGSPDLVSACVHNARAIRFPKRLRPRDSSGGALWCTYPERWTQ